MKRYIWLALPLSLVVGLSSRAMLAQGAGAQDQIVGTWRINLAKTSFARSGPAEKETRPSVNPTDTWTWTFVPERDGLRFSNYASYPAPKPSRTFVLWADGKEHPCTEERSCFEAGDSKGETVSLTRINPNLYVRVGKRNGEIRELVTYAVSADSKTFVVRAWSPETPQYTNIFFFERQ